LDIAVRARVLRLGVVLVVGVAAVVALVMAPGGSMIGRRPLAAQAASATYTPAAVRHRVDLDAGWRFVAADAAGAQAPAFDDSTWSPVDLPHTWNAQDGQDGGGNYHRGAGWYRRHYTPPAALAGQKMWLQFDGANTVTDVWVNGTYLGQHQGGFARFRFDATAALVPGADNVVAVRVSNAVNYDVPPLSADFTFFGGLYRKVALVVTDPLSVGMLDSAGPGLYLRQRSVTEASATVDLTTRVANGGADARTVEVRAIVTDAADVVVAEASSGSRIVPAGGGYDAVQRVVIANPHRWQGTADPYLYRATVEVRDAATGRLTDAVTQPLGLRTVTVDPDAGLFLNGKHVAVHGVNRHQDLLGHGWATSDADVERDFALMDEMGVNALRTAHYQQDQKVYDLADARGYLVWTEIPLVNKINDTDAFRANAMRQLRELIRQNYNHPSVVFWGIGNEQGSDDPPTNALLGALAGLVEQEDPDRLSAYAHNWGIDSGLVNHAEVAGYNKYFGWYHDAYGDLGPYLDALHRAQPRRCIGISEYGAGASVVQHQESPPKPVPGGPLHPEEYQALLHESAWAQIAARPYLWGTFVWNMFDFASDQRGEGDTPGRNDKGLVTYDRRTRKDTFYFYKASWTATPFVYITSRRWTDRTAAVTTVKVYGTADRVLLTVNGVQVGPPKAADNHVYTWPDVTLRPGVNRVQVYGTRGDTTYTDLATWILHG
jgi:beta-galactosidase